MSLMDFDVMIMRENGDYVGDGLGKMAGGWAGNVERGEGGAEEGVRSCKIAM